MLQETWFPSLGWEDPLEKEMATHSSILLGNPTDGRAWSSMTGAAVMESERVRHGWALARAHTHTHRPFWPEHLGKESSKLRCSHVDSKPEGGLEGVTSLHGVLWVQGQCGLWGFFTYVWSLHTCASCDHRLRGAFQVRSLKDTCF